ncbi:hypothetical protein EROM_040020 [Encephalitozoon romaleae SJ-2008]|uniref:Uncharacterized protein n=1 Tax=Encephalitozoon romaleae (strain SJ-2008) TaxID=1178016 RepID=I7AM62_ENCRO|nr:hypothetical protein EROM_040020 [Encephalitozoon romaleae SJ-2008]AFN82774.1 hypothetical protein EROM_040020 [Encephalitozoon romaleae SJ-2008]
MGERRFYLVEFKGPVSMEWVKHAPHPKLRKTFTELLHEKEGEHEVNSSMIKEGVFIVECMSLEEALVDCIKEKRKGQSLSSRGRFTWYRTSTD